MEFIDLMINIYNSFITFGTQISNFFTSPIVVPEWARVTLDVLTVGWFELVNQYIIADNTMFTLIATALPIALPIIIVKDLIF